LCSARFPRKVTVLTAAAAFCLLAATGTAAALTWAAPSASPVQATDMLSLHSLTRTQHAAAARQAAQLNLDEPAVIIEETDRAAHAARHAVPARAIVRRAARQRAAAEAVVQQAPAGAPQQIAQQMLDQDGWAGQFGCLDDLWGQESGWNVYAENPSSGAYGIPQALPASKMASAGLDWQSNPATQISWGLGYIRASYGSPCAAWGHEEAAGWY